MADLSHLFLLLRRLLRRRCPKHGKLAGQTLQLDLMKVIGRERKEREVKRVRGEMLRLPR